MNDISMEERIAIKDSARSLKKYGSTSSNSSSHSRRCESFTKHQVCETDTLAGLALKYSVSTEQLRRANRLWANDSLFLRKWLLIPTDAPSTPSSPGDILLEEDSPVAGSSSPITSMSLHPSNNNNNGKSFTNDTVDDVSYNDFLVKIDCSIASTKSQVIASQDNSEFVDNNAIFWHRKGAMSRLKQQNQQRDDSNSPTPSSNGTTELPTVMTQGRKVRNSLQRLQKEQDEIFEL